MVFPKIIRWWSVNSIVSNCRTGLVNSFMFKVSICIKSMSNVRIIYNWSQFLNICHVSFVSGLNLPALHNQMMAIRRRGTTRRSTIICYFITITRSNIALSQDTRYLHMLVFVLCTLVEAGERTGSTGVVSWQPETAGNQSINEAAR